MAVNQKVFWFNKELGTVTVKSLIDDIKLPEYKQPEAFIQSFRLRCPYDLDIQPYQSVLIDFNVAPHFDSIYTNVYCFKHSPAKFIIPMHVYPHSGEPIVLSVHNPIDRPIHIGRNQVIAKLTFKRTTV